VCSTPFGINGRDTAGAVITEDIVAYVLNAFRHQRKGYSTLCNL